MWPAHVACHIWQRETLTVFSNSPVVIKKYCKILKNLFQCCEETSETPMCVTFIEMYLRQLIQREHFSHYANWACTFPTYMPVSFCNLKKILIYLLYWVHPNFTVSTMYILKLKKSREKVFWRFLPLTKISQVQLQNICIRCNFYMTTVSLFLYHLRSFLYLTQ